MTCLKENGKVGRSKLEEYTNKSRGTVIERLKNLEKESSVTSVRSVFTIDRRYRDMREYTLNDIGFTPGKVEELPINFRVENTVNKDEINEQSQKNRQMGEELLRQFKD